MLTEQFQSRIRGGWLPLAVASDIAVFICHRLDLHASLDVLAQPVQDIVLLNLSAL